MSTNIESGDKRFVLQTFRFNIDWCTVTSLGTTIWTYFTSGVPYKTSAYHICWIVSKVCLYSEGSTNISFFITWLITYLAFNILQNHYLYWFTLHTFNIKFPSRVMGHMFLYNDLILSSWKDGWPHETLFLLVMRRKKRMTTQYRQKSKAKKKLYIKNWSCKCISFKKKLRITIYNRIITNICLYNTHLIKFQSKTHWIHSE